MYRQLHREVGPLGKAEEDRLTKVFARLDVNEDGRIDTEDLNTFLTKLGYEPRKYEVEDMIWEVDEDLDRAISWEEFLKMYQRVRFDTAGLEPRKLFNVVDFVLHDTDGDGYVSIDECFSVMYLRHGKFFREEDVRNLFKDSTDNGSCVSFTEFQAYLRDQHQKLVKGLPSLIASKDSPSDAISRSRPSSRVGTARPKSRAKASR